MRWSSERSALLSLLLSRSRFSCRVIVFLEAKRPRAHPNFAVAMLLGVLLQLAHIYARVPKEYRAIGAGG